MSGMGQKRERTGPGWDDPESIPTGTFIKTYLKEHREAFGMEVWRALKEARSSHPRLKEVHGKTREKPRTHTSYNNFLRNYWEPLIAMGMIVYVRSEVGKGGNAEHVFERKYYKLARNYGIDKRWDHIQQSHKKFRGWGKR